jgi:hypothetical protein
VRSLLKTAVSNYFDLAVQRVKVNSRSKKFDQSPEEIRLPLNVRKKISTQYN